MRTSTIFIVISDIVEQSLSLLTEQNQTRECLKMVILFNNTNEWLIITIRTLIDATHICSYIRRSTEYSSRWCLFLVYTVIPIAFIFPKFHTNVYLNVEALIVAIKVAACLLRLLTISIKPSIDNNS